MAKPALQPGETVDLSRLSEITLAREEAVGWANLSHAEQVFLAVWTLEAEVNNGGFDQFFLNSSGDHASETLSALEEIGAHEMATLLRQALAVFPEAPPSNRERRLAIMESLGEKTRDQWQELDDKFYDLSSAEPLLLKFVETHRADFLRVE